MVSRRIGEAEGVVVLEGSYGPVSEGLRVMTWKAWQWRWKGCLIFFDCGG